MKRSLGDRPVRAKVRATRAPVSVSSPSPRRKAASTRAAGERLAATSRRGDRPAVLRSSDAGVPAKVAAMQESVLSHGQTGLEPTLQNRPADHAGIIAGILSSLASAVSAMARCKLKYRPSFLFFLFFGKSSELLCPATDFRKLVVQIAHFANRSCLLFR